VVGEGKKMDKVYEKLDEAKAEIEKLRAEYKSKAELCENLKKAHNEQLIKSKEASLKSEKQSQDLNEKAEEISVAKQMCEELKCSLNKKESVIRQLSAANDKLRVDCDEKSLKWEKENRDLVLALDQANEKIMDQEQNLRAYREEIEGLKGCLSVSQKKCLGADKRAKASKELRERDDMLLNSEEEKMKLQDQLKWKKEQFAHLQEAHEKLRNQFKASKKDWEQERSTLLDEICSLQTRLDSQTRISEDLKKRLQMCNQALTHEESRRKYLEAQVSEFQKQSENAFAEYQDAKSLLECLTAQRDKEISALRHSLGTKETDYKEMEYQAAKLEQENQELRISLRELQEAGIQESGASSSQAKLRNKLKSLEQMHRDSTVKLRAKEAELNSQIEKMAGDLNGCWSELENKDVAIKELRMELEGYQSLAMQLKLQNEEISVMLLVLKLGISEAQLRLANEKAEMDVQDKEREEKVSLLMKQLEMNNAALSANRAKEADLSSQLEMMAGDLNECRLGLENKDAAIEELRMELEGSQSLAMQLKLQNEEISVMLLVLKLGISEAQLRLANEKAEMDVQDKEREEKVSLLMKQLEMNNAALSANRAKEAGLSSQMEMMAGDLNDCRLGLEDKDTAIEELRMGLEGSQSLAMQLKLQNEEISVMLLVLKLGIYEAQLKLASERAEMDVHDKEREEHVSLLMKQLEMKNAALFAKRDKEAELSSQTEKMAGDLKACQFELENKDAAIEELRMELEGCQSLAMQLKLQNEEISVMLLVLKLGISEAQSKLANERIEMDVHDKEREEKVSLLMKQLEMKNSAPSEAQLKLAKEKAELDVYAKEREDNVSLLMKQLEMKNAALLRAQKDTVGEREKAESLDGQRLLMQKELERYKDLLEESSRCQLRLKEQVLQMESSSKEKLGEVCEALERANAEYAEKICENNEIEFELQLWKSIAERLKCDLEENHAVRKELEASLLSQVDVGETIKQEKNSLIQMLEERDRRIDDLQQQIVFLDHKLGARETEAASFAGMETEMSFDPEKVSFFQTTREKDKVLEQFEKEVAWLEQESLRRELESAVLSQTVAERTFAHEKEKLIHQLEDKNQRLHDLMQQVKSLEQEFNSSLVSFSSQLAKKQAEINLVHEAWERLTAAEILTVLEVEEKKLMIVELEDDISNMHQKLELQEQSFCHSRQQALEIEAELDAKQLEIKNLTTQMETKLRTSDALVNELKNEKRSLLEDAMKLLSDRENLLGFITGMGDGISEFSTANSQLMSDLSQMVQSFDNNDSGMVSKEDEELFQSVKENWNIHSSPATKKCEVISDGRPPFRERNN
jgi:chromosome segregation ATPase